MILLANTENNLGGIFDQRVVLNENRNKEKYTATQKEGSEISSTYFNGKAPIEFKIHRKERGDNESST